MASVYCLLLVPVGGLRELDPAVSLPAAAQVYSGYQLPVDSATLRQVPGSGRLVLGESLPHAMQLCHSVEATKVLDTRQGCFLRPFITRF